jgi:hypothetical protein
LQGFGYPQAAQPDLLKAFRLRFRPHGYGALQVQDAALAAGLRAFAA